MNEHEIRDARYNNTLKDLIAEGIATLNDKTISGLNVLDVKVSRGKENAVVYMDAEEYTKEDLEKFSSRLEKASGYISKYVLASMGKFRVPVLKFKFDDTTEALSKIDELFKRIEDDRKNKRED